MKFVLVLSLLVAASYAALADETAPLPPLAAYGEQNPDCLEWTNSCVVCRRVSDKEIACSTPGIACQPGGLICVESRKSNNP